MTKQRFPHLQNTTAFPGNNGQPYSQYPNDFEYDRWGVGTKLTVCRVPWDLDSNVVDWNSNDDILNYFHNLDSSSSFKLESELNREPDGSIRLPIPISNLKKYNYLFVEYVTPTTPEQPLDYASGERQPFIGFFMSDFAYVAPSTTEASLVTDWWTTSITSIEIQNMMLERGHAPMAATKVDEYLKDPLHNNRYLLTSDVSFGDPCITTSAQFESWMATTEPLMVLAVKATLEQAQAMLAEKEVGGKNTPPEFEDTSDRWGKQYQVNGYSWAGVSPFKDTTVESTPWSTATGLPAGVSMIAVKATDAQTFLTYVQNNSPELFEVVQSCFLIPGSLVASKEAGTYGGVPLFELKPLEELPPVPVKLEKEDFGYPEEYSKIAKLYTFPYAGLTFSDNDGHSVDVRIEYTSSVQIHRRVSLAYPYLRAQAFLSGVNGTGNTSYEWVDAAGLKKTGSMPQADWTQTLLEYSIPTYALAQTAISQALLKNSTPAAIERLKALTAYQNGARSLNTATKNAYDSADTAHDNGIRSNDTGKQNGDRSNETGKTNSLASNATANANTLRSNATGYSNAIASAATAKSNADRSADASRQAITNSVAASNDKLGYRNSNADASYSISKKKLWSTNKQNIALRKKIMGPLVPDITLKQLGQPFTYGEDDHPSGWPLGLFDTKSWYVNTIDEKKMRELVDNSSIQTLMMTKADQTNWYTSQIAQVTGIQAAATGIAETAASVATTGSIAEGGYAAPIGAAVSTARTLANTALSTDAAKAQWLFNTNEAFYDLAGNYANMEKQNSYDEAMSGGSDTDGKRSVNLEAMYRSKEQGKRLDQQTTNRENGLAGSNGDLSQETTKANAAASQKTSNGNALASKNTADNNANSSFATANANTNRSYDTTKANISASWSTTKQNVDQTQATTKANAGYSQDASLLNAKTNLKLAQDTYEMSIMNAQTSAPLTVGANSGDPLPDLWGQRGVEIRVKTQPLGAIASAGSEMLRYGYQLGQAWRFTGWSVMRHFSYWKASDLWLTPKSSFAELGKAAIRGIIENGITVWRKPEEIGTVSVTENWED